MRAQGLGRSALLADLRRIDRDRQPLVAGAVLDAEWHEQHLRLRRRRRQGAGGSLAASSGRVLDRFLNVLPSVTIREGHRLRTYLTKASTARNSILRDNRDRIRAALECRERSVRCPRPDQLHPGARTRRTTRAAAPPLRLPRRAGCRMSSLLAIRSRHLAGACTTSATPTRTHGRSSRL